MFVCNLNSSTGIDLEFFYFLLPAVCCFFFNAFIEIKLSEIIGSDFASTKDFFKFSISERYVSYTITETRFFRSTCSNSCSYTFIKGSFAISFVFFSASSSLTTQILIRKNSSYSTALRVSDLVYFISSYVSEHLFLITLAVQAFRPYLQFTYIQIQILVSHQDISPFQATARSV